MRRTRLPVPSGANRPTDRPRNPPVPTPPNPARACLAEFRERYNRLRPHWALVPESGGDPVTPEDVYLGRTRPQLPRWQAWARAAQEKMDQLTQAAA